MKKYCTNSQKNHERRGAQAIVIVIIPEPQSKQKTPQTQDPHILKPPLRRERMFVVCFFFFF